MTRLPIIRAAGAAALACALLAGCGGGAASGDPDQAAIESVPTEAEADAAATEAIDADNAEEALDDLLEEIESDTGG